VRPVITSGCPASGPVRTPSAVTPHCASAFSKLGITAKMPIEPVIVAGWKICAPGVETQ
jgi:hypothetical protein